MSEISSQKWQNKDCELINIKEHKYKKMSREEYNRVINYIKKVNYELYKDVDCSKRFYLELEHCENGWFIVSFNDRDVLGNYREELCDIEYNRYSWSIELLTSLNTWIYNIRTKEAKEGILGEYEKE